MDQPQNIYDNETFFQSYKRSVLDVEWNPYNDGLDRSSLLRLLLFPFVPEDLSQFAPFFGQPKEGQEKQEIQEKGRDSGKKSNSLPRFETVLDLGCGSGKMWPIFASHFQTTTIFGVDVSQNMLSQARKSPLFAQNSVNIHLFKISLETFSPSHLPSSLFHTSSSPSSSSPSPSSPSPSSESPSSESPSSSLLVCPQIGEKTLDLVYSGLAFHYVEDITSLLQRIYPLLKNGGIMVLSVEHPFSTAIINPNFRKIVSPENPDVIHCYGVDNYQTEGERVAKWTVDDVKIYHRTLSTYLNTFVECGFVLERVEEPFGSVEDNERCPALESASRRPPFICFRLRKN